MQADGPPLWASLFNDQASEEKASRYAPWYIRENNAWKPLDWPDAVCSLPSWEKRFYAAIDVETTGLNPKHDRVVEIGIACFSFDNEGALVKESTFASLINPCVPISQSASSIHGIRDEDVANAPLFSEISGKIDQLIQSRVLVGHNVLFDIGFLEEEFQKSNIQYRFAEAADSLGLAKKAFPGMASYNLGKLAFQLHLIEQTQHRALEDAIMSMKIFAAAVRSLTMRCDDKEISSAKST